MKVMQTNTLNIELKSHFLNLYFLALSDTQIDSQELEMLFQLGQNRGIDKEEIERIILHPDSVRFTIPKDTLTKIEYLYDYVTMILADGKIDEQEELTLKKFCIKFGFDEQNIPAIMQFLIQEAINGTDKNTIIEQVKQTL
ncbi:tellurite resistance TerB family protein [Pontibacter sp. CAU 1760]